MSTHFSLDFPRAWGEPVLTAQLKVEPEDFYVEEQLGFEPSGAGEHLYLFIEKRNHNTQAIAEQLAKAAKIKLSDVSYAGMKDRRALTRQWFSLYLQKKAGQPQVEWTDLNGVLSTDGSVRVLRVERHTKKLRRGEHAGNFFRIRLHNVQGDITQLETRLKTLVEHGVPNYYGEQRFGNQGSNLQHIDTFLLDAKGKQRGFHDRLTVSAMRSWLFNQVLAERVRMGTWNCRIDGDPEDIPTAPLWGRGRLASSGLLRVCEDNVMSQYPDWCHFLEHCGLQQERRALLLLPTQFTHSLAGGALELEFSLPRGAYATVLLRELAQLTSENALK